MLLISNPTVDKITSYIREMSSDEQQAILDAFEKKSLMARAARLNKSVNRNIKISIAEVIAEINTIRSKHTNKGNRI